MSEELKPCPFCGGEPFMVGAEIDGREHYIVKCTACHSTSGVMQMNRSKAAEAWNRRAERTCHLGNHGGLPGRADLLACDECGGVTYDMYPHPRYCPNCGAKVVSGDGY